MRRLTGPALAVLCFRGNVSLHLLYSSTTGEKRATEKFATVNEAAKWIVKQVKQKRCHVKLESINVIDECRKLAVSLLGKAMDTQTKGRPTTEKGVFIIDEIGLCLGL